MERWFSIQWCVSRLVSSRESNGESNGESKGWVYPKVIDDPDGVVKIDSFKGGLIVPGCGFVQATSNQAARRTLVCVGRDYDIFN